MLQVRSTGTAGYSKVFLKILENVFLLLMFVQVI